MFKPLQSILFATNLTENCRPAFEFAASMAIRYQATLVLLHVLEKAIPDYIEGRLRGMLGEDKWKEIGEESSRSAKQFLIGKRSPSRLVQEAMEAFCSEAGIDDASCGYQSREIVVSQGDLEDEIIGQAQKFNCDLIVMGTHKGFLKSNTIGPTIKNVMRRSRIPVLVVPPGAEHTA